MTTLADSQHSATSGSRHSGGLDRVAGASLQTPPGVRIAAALDALRAGHPILVADNANRENEVDIILDAARVTQRWLAWTIRHSSGYLCAPMSAKRADALELPIMVANNEDRFHTAYTVSVDAAQGVSTGISAADRSHTLNVLADPASGPASLIRPGHVLPLRARPGGVLERAGHTEAGVDLVALSHGLSRNGMAVVRELFEEVQGTGIMGRLLADPVAARAAHVDTAVACIGELVRDDGDMMRVTEALAFADEFGLVMITIAELRAFLRGNADADAISGTGKGAETRLQPDIEDLPHRDGEPAAALPGVIRTGSARLPTRHGEFTISNFRDLSTGIDHIALTFDRVNERPIVRVHSECLTGEAFGSLRCDCGPQLDAALEAVAREGGAVVYLRGHEGRGIGIAAKVDAYALQDGGRDTVDANLDLGFPVDMRDYAAAAAILDDLGLTRVRLLSNSPDKANSLRTLGIEVLETIELASGHTPENEGYLRTKASRLGHHIPGMERNI